MSKWKEAMKAWKAPKVRSLIRHYGRRVKKAGRHPEVARDPRFLAGSMLVVFGGAAVAKCEELQGMAAEHGPDAPPRGPIEDVVAREGLRAPAAKVKRLLEEALDQELVMMKPACNFCGRGLRPGEKVRVNPHRQWLATADKWACPECVESLHLNKEPGLA